LRLFENRIEKTNLRKIKIKFQNVFWFLVKKNTNNETFQKACKHLSVLKGTNNILIQNIKKSIAKFFLKCFFAHK